jgi:hypothetical protein
MLACPEAKRRLEQIPYCGGPCTPRSSYRGSLVALFQGQDSIQHNLRMEVVLGLATLIIQKS